MFQNYITTALRNILKHKLYSAINIFGLAIGLMSCILILLFVQDEVSYDKWFPESEKVVRLHTGYFTPGRVPFETVASAGRMAPAIKEFASDLVDKAGRLVFIGPTITKDDKIFNESVTLADPEFLDIFNLPMIKGNSKTALSKPGDMIISENMAIKYFGSPDVLGETLVLCCVNAEPYPVKITGVMKNLPTNTHLRFNFLGYLDPPIFKNASNMLETWTSVNTYGYFKLKDGVTAQDLENRIVDWKDSKVSPFVEMMASRQVQNGSDSSASLPKPSEMIKHRVMYLNDLHLNARKHSGNMGDLSPMGDINMVYAFSGIAILILVIACINFMNLSTARASARAREVALRKVMGASRTQVAVQLLGEAIITTFFALIIAIMGVELTLPFYSNAVDKELSLDYMNSGALLGGLMGLSVAVGLISGSYPALYLSRFMPAKILKSNQSSSDGGSGNLRSVLVIFQFAISIGLMVATAVVYGQTTFAQNKDPGYTTQNKLIVNGLRRASMRDQKDALKQQLLRIDGVTGVAFSSEAPSEDNENNTGFALQSVGGDEATQAQSVIINYYSIGYDFLDVYDIKPLYGRGFEEARGSDERKPPVEDDDSIQKSSVLINEMAATQLGFSNAEDAIGRALRQDSREHTIIGVLPNIHFRSLKFGIRPSIYWLSKNRFNRATVQFDTENISKLVTDVENVWKTLAPTTPPSHAFLSEMLGAQYSKEKGEANLFAAFSLLAVLVASLGLYGLASFTAERRTKEIGLRKVMGARVFDIIRLLVWQYSKYVLIANIIAWPIAGYFMLDWLENFQYRMDIIILPILFVLAGLVALLIAWGTVASHAAGVARTNPIKALRYE
jgi:putative ABC transport system permease protein